MSFAQTASLGLSPSWPSVIQHLLHAALDGCILGIAVVVGFRFFSRLGEGSPSIAKRFIATTIWFGGTYFAAIGTIFTLRWVLHPLSYAPSAAVGMALVWVAFKLPSWLTRVEHWLRRDAVQEQEH